MDSVLFFKREKRERERENARNSDFAFFRVPLSRLSCFAFFIFVILPAILWLRVVWRRGLGFSVLR